MNFGKVLTLQILLLTISFSSCVEEPIDKGSDLKDVVHTYGSYGDYKLACEPSEIEMPNRIKGLNNVLMVDAAEYHSIALTKNGKVFVWGLNYNSILAVDPNLTYVIEYPHLVEGLPEIMMISSSDNSTLALDYQGNVWVWGQVNYNESYVPDKLDIANIVHVSSGANHCLAVDAEGIVYAWGDNGSGQLGDGSRVDKSNPVAITLPDKIVKVSAGYRSSYAVSEEGNLYAWGENGDGQLGLGMYSDQYEPARVPIDEKVLDLAAAVEYCLCLVEGGEVYSCGYNSGGNLGLDTDVFHISELTLISGISDVQMIDASDRTSIALTNDGRLWSWGRSISNTSTPTSTRYIYYSTPQHISVITNSPTACATSNDHLIYISD